MTAMYAKGNDQPVLVYSIATVPAVPVVWQWYIGLRWKWLRPQGCGGGRIWWFARNFYFGKPHNPTPKQEARYRGFYHG